MPSRKASTTHQPPIELIHRWRCCLPECTQANSHTTTTHFVPVFSVEENHIIRAPGYYGQECTSCCHPACNECCFLEVKRVDGWSASGPGERNPWEKIGYWDRRQDFAPGEAAGLRRTDGPPPRARKELVEAWKRNGRWDT